VTAFAGRFAHPWLVRTAQVAVGLVFVTAALAKIGDAPYFSQQVHNYHLSPLWAENLVAMTFPWMELVAGVALVTGTRRRAAAFVALAFMAFFTVAVAAAWARGLDFNCGCFGKAGAASIGAAKFAENVGLTLLAWVAFLQPRD
jgi:putative oxidoreductase